MISARLVHLIELNWEQVLSRTIAQLHREPDPIANHTIDQELREWTEDVVHNLGHWLSGDNEKQLAVRFEQLGQLCYQQGSALHETVRGLTALRQKMLDVAQENLISNSSMELYAEEELDRRLGRFFDRLTVQLVRGFERALHSAPDPNAVIH